jgi:cell wall-associated NlpC family hydrolase
MQVLQNPTEEWIERHRVVAEALSWQKTPYLHEARLKDIGCDCITLLAGVFENAGLIARVPIEHYPQDWMHHRDAERYMEGLMQYAGEIARSPQPGDIALWKFGRCYSHGAIVIEWPLVLHARPGCGVVQENVWSSPWLTYIGENVSDKGKLRPVRFFSFWRK